MDQWMTWPWMEMLMACTCLTGLGLVFFLILNRFPASRFLGQLVIVYLGFALFSHFVSDEFWRELSLMAPALSLSWYGSAFFTQNSRISPKHVGLISLAIVLATAAYYFDQLWLVNCLTIVILFDSVQKVKKEAASRGIFWFQNSGARIVWFRNYFGLNILLLLSFLFLGQILSIEFIWAGILINFLFIYIQIFRESGFASPIPVSNKYKKSTLSAAQKAGIVENLDKLLVETKFYLKDDISLGGLATQLHTTTHHLSQVLNENKGVSFQELISQYRIREARHLLKDPEQKNTKVENIAALVGYNSKSAFNTAFKRHTGLTPSEYRDRKDVRSYREVLLPNRKKPSSTGRTFSLSHLFTKKLKRTMITNFFKTFIRTLNRNKVFTFINLFGLTVGFTCSILIYLFIAHELSYDQSLPNHENIYRISWIAEHSQTRTPHPMAQAIRRDFPEVKNAVSFSPWYGTGLTKQEIKVENKQLKLKFDEPDFYFADSTFLDVFQLEVVAGDQEALKEPNTLVITEAMAIKYFGEANAIGQILNVSDMPMEVSLVVKGMPKNAHFHFNALISYETVKAINPESHWMTWADFGHFNYILMEEGSSPSDLQSKIGDWVLQYLNWDSGAKDRFDTGQIRFELQPIADIHLHSHLRWELENNGNILYVYILIGTMFFILIIAAINYVNLTTAKSVERAKEIGVRKTLGAVSRHLTAQFYLESVLFCFVALILALGLTGLVMNHFNQLADKTFSFNDLLDYAFIGKALLLCFAIGLLAGIYPAIFLSSFKPSDVLKGKLSVAGESNRLRSLLVVCQFIVSAILITSSLIILKQIDFMQSKELGFDQEAVISIPIPSSVEHGGINLSEARAIQNELRAITGVKQVSAASNLPGSQFDNHPVTSVKYHPDYLDATEVFVDFGLTELLGFELVSGRALQSSYAADSAGTNVLINETAARSLNLKQPIGEKLAWHLGGYDLEITVIGVVKDFHYKSLHQTINPLIIQHRPELLNHMVLKLDGKNFQQTLEAIEMTYTKFDQEEAFEFHFLDQQLGDLYESEVRTLSVFSIFTCVALFLACLGLLGIALAMLSQKVKEVGIRKILGARPIQIIQMIFAQFAALVGIALAIGLPIAHLLMQEWLMEFPYQTTLGFMPFVWSAVALLTVALASVSMVVLKIAATSPVKALRYE
ncbi:AraC-type DNA-binding protein [Reichenbachiella faecimaris]|uniref:AraC-type DNA-binding protein n=1 Tax=Reichenbachiella faecimaris TaxID=692418 RepID=A0A1W2GF48_REIFA|nr:ABC transporter permease [Reichenbachiella faecimaris]SMD34886.1 AraC-type DNA-binding protein [Reichenbachiella faecimaris]